MPETFSAVVIGAGHAGLSASHFLTGHSIDHVVLERGEVANSWRTERWDSLRLLTPNWQSRLPGHHYAGDNPDGYMTMGEVVEFIDRFALVARAPVRTGVTVTSVRKHDEYVITYDRAGPRSSALRPAHAADHGEIRAEAVVIASGACNTPSVPPLSAAVPGHVDQVTAFDYRGPDKLAEGPVLVVGASATGVQLADEIRRSGREVTLSVGEHVRMPRLYRGKDVLWWMDATGVWNQRHDEVDDLDRARRLPSPQLVGTPERRTLDLNALTEAGVALVGRLASIRDGDALFSGGLRNVFALADLKLERLLDTFDEWATANGVDAGEREPVQPTRTPARPPWKLNLADVSTVVWATGYRPDYSWLDVPVLDSKGHLIHDGGVVSDSPGLYALGLPVLRRRASTFIHGIEDDARAVVEHLRTGLGRPPT